MRKIKLYGELGKKFGQEFNLDVKSPAEAVRALCCQLLGFEQYLLDSEKHNIGFKVYESGNLLAEDQLGLQGTGEIKIVPLIGGANGEFRVLVGAALIAASFFTGPLQPYLMNAGIALAVGGVLQMMVGPPVVPKPNEKPENTPSYAFNGPVNTTAQGHPVPVGYGRLVVGSAVISAALTTQSLMAGYVQKQREAYMTVVALNGPDYYWKGRPPANYIRRELISTGRVWLPYTYAYANAQLYPYDTWTYKFTYYETYLELQTI